MTTETFTHFMNLNEEDEETLYTIEVEFDNGDPSVGIYPGWDVISVRDDKGQEFILEDDKLFYLSEIAMEKFGCVDESAGDYYADLDREREE